MLQDFVLHSPAPVFDQGRLSVSGGHRLYYEQCGRPEGLAVLVLHGGPGSGCSAAMTRFFDPGRYRIVLLDQRGAGRSTPRGGLRENSTQALLADLERLRARLGIGRWLVFGGSWGATLAVLYAAACRAAVLGVLLRGLFLARAADLDWFLEGARSLFPQAWREFADVLGAREGGVREALVQAMERGAPRRREAVALAWRDWERSLAGLAPAPASQGAERAALVAKYRVQARYFEAAFFLRREALLHALPKLAGLPVLLVHGRRDLVCRPEGAWLAQRALAGSRLLWVDEAGHDPYAGPMAEAVTRAAAGFAAQGDFAGLGCAA